ncbi:MAG: family 10 glycosylhydrolase [Bacteroidetes bacterium]|nr:family 10 glycosylhydrolase [Bacteroidota bacterium]
MRFIFSILFIGFFIFTNGQPKTNDKNVFEFRGVWVATVENIDWPSKRGLSNEEQKNEFIALLNKHQQNGMNAIVMQVRPSGDAMYPSTLEPWSEYLMGTQGLGPSPFYDPLLFMIQETHKRGMEFHAWINPYRAVFNINKSSISPNHLTKLHPDWFLTYGDKKYFNPGLPEVWLHTNRVVRDLVNRYDIDAIHMDDYFYPYRIAGKEFPDQATYTKNTRGLNKEDWRRSNCDTIIKQLNATIRQAKPGVQFGISPFGVWRNKSVDPKGSNTKAGQTNYDDLYADILLWLEKGWIDYVTPQIYWEHGHPLADYDELINWWNDNSYGKNLYIGHGIYRAGTNVGWKDKNEIPYQINRVRSLKNTNGSIYFSSKSFSTNANGWNDSLQQHYYQRPALLPPMPWLVQYAMETPIVVKKSATEYAINNTQKTGIKQYAILKKENDIYSVEAMINGPITSIQFKKLGIQKNQDAYYWIVAIGKQNQISKLVLLP